MSDYNPSDFKPGDICLITPKGTWVKPFIAIRGVADIWREVGGTFQDKNIQSARRLVVIDPENEDQVRQFIAALDDVVFPGTDPHSGLAVTSDRVGNFTTALRLQIKPHRIDEPTKWGVVRAGWSASTVRNIWTNHGENWISDLGAVCDWSHLIDPVLIREGI